MNLSTLKIQIEEQLKLIDYTLYDIEYVKENNRNILRIYIDNEDEIAIGDCEIASRKLSDFLDLIDPIQEEYYLEVSSPGAERELRSDKDMERHIGYDVLIETYEQTLEGILFKVYENSIILQIKGKNVTISKIDIQKIRLAIKF